jgi:hypothetical protein
MNITAHLTLLFTVGLFFTSMVLAQQATGGKEDTRSGAWNSYDVNNIVSVRGEVQKVEESFPARGMPPWIQLTLRTDNGEVLTIYLGPQWYIEDKDFEVAPKDNIEVKGSRIMYAGRPTIVAAVVFMGDAVLKLRDEKGIPVWAVWLPRQ